jgi:Predicted thioesterase
MGKKLIVEMPLMVNSFDVDFMQIVNNTVYVKWFEQMRMKFLDDSFPLADMLAVNCSPILAETCVKYLRPVTLRSNLLGRMWITELDRSRWVFEFEISETLKEGEDESSRVIYSTGRQMGYYYNVELHRPVRFPDWFLKKFTPKDA